MGKKSLFNVFLKEIYFILLITLKLMKTLVEKFGHFKKLSRVELIKIGGGQRDQCTPEQVNTCTFVQYYPEGSVMMDCGSSIDADGDEVWIPCEAHLA